jgi:LacI family transcriptional regulator
VPSKQGPPTLADVAALAGVSIATVSKVLNRRADVGPGTRARVQSILQQHDYVDAGATRSVLAMTADHSAARRKWVCSTDS